MDAPPIKRHPQITNLRKPIWLRGAVMGISRFPIRPGVYLRNINSARPRGPFFFNRNVVAATIHALPSAGNGSADHAAHPDTLTPPASLTTPSTPAQHPP